MANNSPYKMSGGKRNETALLARDRPSGARPRWRCMRWGLVDRIEMIDHDADKGNALRQVNPLHKIPMLIADDGSAIFDSPVILEYLDEIAGGGRIMPARGLERYKTLSRLASPMASPRPPFSSITKTSGARAISACQHGLPISKARSNGHCVSLKTTCRPCSTRRHGALLRAELCRPAQGLGLASECSPLAGWFDKPNPANAASSPPNRRRRKALLATTHSQSSKGHIMLICRIAWDTEGKDEIRKQHYDGPSPI